MEIAIKIVNSAFPHYPMYVHLKDAHHIPSCFETMVGADSKDWPAFIETGEFGTFTMELVEVEDGFIDALEPWEL